MSTEVDESKRQTSDYAVNLEGDTGPAKVVRMVGSGKKVLEIGIGPGAITRHLFAEGQCQVSAIEMDNEAIESARPFCEKIYKVDLNHPQWPDLVSDDEGYDVVIAADVLERLHQPWETLGEIKELLNENGSIVVSLPHVGHCAMTACLMAEDFEYKEWGLLDRTHIRFFGIKNIQALFENAGLKLVEAEFVILEPEKTEFAHHWNKLSEQIQQGLLENPFSTVYQVVVRAIPQDKEGGSVSLMDLPVEKYVPPSPYMDSPAAANPSTKDVKLIAFYLPQYHPIPENDLWWGKGFTEWSNVTKAMPLFPGHYQPHLPSDFGFYDLRLSETRNEQIEMAKKYGIDGFCYHYYWFSGKRLLDRPLDDMLADRESNMPFCLCWANENWTRRWDGAEHELLIAQEYREEDDLEFIKSVIPFFRDSRYIHKDGVPFLIVYRPQHFLDAKKSTAIWREHCRKEGFAGLHVCCALTHGNEDYHNYGFDSGVEFPPHNANQRNINDRIPFEVPFEGHAIPYHSLANSYLNRKYEYNNVFRTVFPSWDNTARTYTRAVIAINGTPANYEYWLSETIRRTAMSFPGEERFVFINAWNEWAEGCHLEPDRRYGHQFLEATYRAKAGISLKTEFEDRMLPISIPEHEVHEGPPPKEEEVNAMKELYEKLGEAQLELDHLRGEVKEIYSSTSWRVSSPIRALGHLRKKNRK